MYILSSRSRCLYVGVTNNLERRLYEHRQGQVKFTSKYRINRLMYYEVFADPTSAITREKVIKDFRRSKKIALIESCNSLWQDLAADWFKDTADPSSLRSSG